MRKKITLVMAIIAVMCTIVACNKKDDELVLVTTEATTIETTEITTEEATTEAGPVIEEAVGRDSNISYEDLYEANKGDVLLSGGVSYGMNTIFYSGEEESFSEYQYLGFDNLGMYTQVYENSDGKLELLDAANMYWYVVEDNALSVLIYPEPLVAAAIIDSNHNAMIFRFADDTNSAEIVQNVYRRDGVLVVESEYANVNGTNFMFEYVLSDDWKVQEVYCYDMERQKQYYSCMTEGVAYEVPEIITKAQAMEQGYRTVSVVFVDGEEIDMSYYTPLDVPVQLSMVEYEAYSDSACTSPWAELEPDENGVYKDVTIYMKKNTKEGE